MRWQGRLFTIFLILCSSAVMVAQGSTSSLRGDVADSSGAAVVGAQVALKNPATGFSTFRATDSTGAYCFLGVPAGTYAVSVTAKGFAAQLAVVELLVNQQATQTFSLSVEALETVVMIDAGLGEALELK